MKGACDGVDAGFLAESSAEMGAQTFENVHTRGDAKWYLAGRTPASGAPST